MKMKPSVITGIAMLCLASACKKEQASQENTYDNLKEKIAQLDEAYKNRVIPMTVFPSSNSWSSSASIPVPVLTKFYYCYSTASPLGSGYVRFNYQIEVDAATQDYLCTNKSTKRLEFRFGTYYTEQGPTGGWKYYTATGLRACADWPRCFYVDFALNGTLSIPDIVVASIVDISGSSNYSTGGTVSSYGWNGAFSFTTPPTYSISKSYQMDPYPGPGATPCP